MGKPPWFGRLINVIGPGLLSDLPRPSKESRINLLTDKYLQELIVLILDQIEL